MRNSLLKHVLAVCLFGGLFNVTAQAQNFVIAPASTWQYFKALAEPSSPDLTEWRQIGFNDTDFGWETGDSPFYYENDPASGTAFTGNTQLTDMFGGYTGIYMRRTFNVADPAIFESLTLNVSSDDGCIIWINGVEVLRVNVAAGNILYNGTSNGAAGEPNVATELITDLSMIVAGENVLAVHALNSSIGSSSDFVIEVSLESAIDNMAPVVISELPPATATVVSLNEIEVFFSEPVTGIDASDLLINGQPATDVAFGSSSSAAFMFSQPPTGTVNVAFAPGHGITDLSPLANPFAGGSWFYTLDPNAEPPGVIISEFMASNDDTLNDDDGDNSDWIELKNAGSTSANMDGWYLTDNANDLTKWRMPGVTILANEFLVVFASGKDRTNILAPLHTSFGLSAGGEYLALVNPQGEVVSAFSPTYPPQSTDVSYGRDRAVPERLGFFPVPTPGAQNSDGGVGFGPEVQFSVESRAFQVGSPFNVALSVDSPTAVIHYTTDNTLPTESSPIYGSPIPVNATTQIRARAYETDPDILPGPQKTHYYIAVEAGVYTRNVDLPQIIMHTFGGGTANQTAELLVIMMVFEKKSGFSNLGNPPDLTTRGRIKIRGSSTAGYAKQSWAMESWDEFNEDTDIELLGMPSERDWVFYAPNNFEPSLIHNPLAQELQNQMGVYGPRTRFAVVHYKDDGGVPGTVVANDYNGIYVVMEKIKRDQNRVDIENLQPEHVNEPEVTGGYLLKVDRLDPGDSGFSAAGQTIAYVDPKEPEIELPQRDPQEQYIRNYFASFGTALNGANYTDPELGYAKYLDIDAAIIHSIHNTLTFNVDALRLSGYFSKTRDRVDQYGRFIPGKIVYGPSWDFDRTQGSTDGRDNNPRVWSKNLAGDQGTDFWKYTWWNRLFTDPNFFQAWIDRYQDLREPGQPFHLETLFATIDGLVDQVKNEQPREQARWNITPRGGSYAAEIQLWKKDWFSNRLDFADSQFLAKPNFNNQGGNVEEGFQLTIGAPEGGTIYYTMDGSDPRASGGSVAPGALTYSGPITINDNVQIFARAFNLNHDNAIGNVGDSKNPPISSHWSGRTIGSFVVRTPPLIISEIMYNPAPPPAGNTNDANGYEFIELKNIGSTTLSLARFELTGGILFDFTGSEVITLAAGDTVLVVKNKALFESRYGTGANIAGEYLGNLANDGEQITLIGSAREIVHDFSFDDNWYPSTDGFGFSLVVADENQPREAWATREGWRVGSVLGGTPDASEPADPNIPVVYVNEALTHTDLPDVDAIELYNPDPTAAVDISGWFLSDDFRNPKFEIPNGTIIPANGYVVFTEADFNKAGDTNGFNLRSSGDEVYVYSGDGAGNLTGYVHGHEFGASLNGVTFGRYITSQGEEHFVAQSSKTLGAANAGPNVGPIVISEIMYHPPDDFINGEVIDNPQNEYVELSNITGSAVPLYDPNATTNTWRLRDAIDYSFPMNQTLAAGERVLVVSFDPTLDPETASAFRTTYGLNASVRLFGPFEGRLSNGNDDVELIQPDVVRFYTTNVVVTGVIIDKVDYVDMAPWPLAADGIGPSLQRISDSSYGNDPINWSGATPSPGDGYSPGPAPMIVTQPVNQVAVLTREASFSVAVSGAGPFRYQWLHDGNVIPSGTNAVLELANIKLADAGIYQVVVLNNANTVASDPATLSVEIPASITLHPQSKTVTEGASVTFSVGALSSSTVTYQWRKDGVNIPGQTGQTYTINNVDALTHRGVYDVAVTDAVGTIFTDPAVLTVLVPAIVIHPAGRMDLRVVQGQDLIVSVELDERTTLPVSYRWRRGFVGTPPEVMNSHSSYFVMRNVQPPRILPYDNWLTVSMTNAASSVSLTITNDITVLTDADGDFMADEFEMANSLNMNDPSDKDMDPDGDGMTSYEESIAGTDPQQGDSYLKTDGIADGDGLEITFEAKASRTYTVEYKNDLSDAFWQKLTDVAADTSDRTVTVKDKDGSPTRIYRLGTPQIDYGDRFPHTL